MNFSQIEAVSITSHTLLGISGEPPFKRGNCFSFLTEEGEYKIVNFCLENLEVLFRKGLLWPVKIFPIGGKVAIIHDQRIGDRWYMDHFCEVCCPEDLLPLPQQARLNRMVLRGERVIEGKWVSMFPPKEPVL